MKQAKISNFFQKPKQVQKHVLGKVEIINNSIPIETTNIISNAQKRKLESENIPPQGKHNSSIHTNKDNHI